MAGDLVDGRVAPALPPGAYRTFELDAPRPTHRRPASCAEVDCEHHAKGWLSRVEPDSDMERALLAACRGQLDGRRRAFRALPLEADGRRPYLFEAGQACLRASTHTISLEREPLYVVRGGDWRAQLGERHTHSRPEHWVEEFATNQQRLSDAIERG